MFFRKTVVRTVLWLLTVVCAAAILSLSLQPASGSSALSSGLTHRVLCWFSAYRGLPFDEQARLLGQVQMLVREAAHIAEFMLLSTLASSLAVSYVGRRFWRYSLAATVVFALLDESVQGLFADGRAFQFIDLAKDWLGCALGAVAVGLYVRKKKEKRV